MTIPKLILIVALVFCVCGKHVAALVLTAVALAWGRK